MRNKPIKTPVNKIGWGFKILFLILVLQIIYLGLAILFPKVSLGNISIYMIVLLLNIFILSTLSSNIVVKDSDIYEN